MHAATALLSATWFDGRSPVAQDVELQWTGTELLLHHRASGATRHYAAREVHWPERTRHGQRQVLLPDGGVIHLPDAAAWDDWARQLGQGQSLAVRWALSWRSSLAALVLLLALMALAWHSGIPWAAQRVADWVPASWEARFGESVMDELRDQGWLQDSRLPAPQRQRIDAAVKRLLAAVPADWALPPVQVHLHRAPAWLGPNAFALPGGQIVVTDALVELLDRGDGPVDEALLGVIAHEIGHVRHRHGLRMVVQASLVSALASVVLGDTTGWLATVPAVLGQQAYSRDFEREADDESIRVLRANRLSPAVMAVLFERLREAQQKDADDDEGRPFALPIAIASHPSDEERIARFRDAQ